MLDEARFIDANKYHIAWQLQGAHLGSAAALTSSFIYYIFVKPQGVASGGSGPSKPSELQGSNH